ncbi:MAG TPA: lysine-sensitive aspartokinase 3 [Rectinemataceae bacterium]|nr:lysine-sensitive aspartokinase 3 [Rectinemataceae bacterium]
MSAPVVMKFGGSSVATAERLRHVAELVRAQGSPEILVVLSALGGVTDALFACGRLAATREQAASLTQLKELMERHRDVGRELFGPNLPRKVEAFIDASEKELSEILCGASLLGALPERSLDLLVGRGELLSSLLLAAYLEVPWIDARLVLRTDSHFGQARPLPDEIRSLALRELLPKIEAGGICVTQGYIGADASGAPTTLGRGGSDFSASLLGAALRAAEIQIWTDVEGVLTCDPRIVPEAQPVEQLGYDEAAELAAFGAKVLHPATILPAVELDIPVTVRNSLLPDGRYTVISRSGASGRPVTALASRGPVSVLTVKSARMLGGSGFLARIFEVFGRQGVSVDLVSTSEVSVSITVEANAPLEDLARELSAFAEVRVERERAVVALVGEQLRRTAGVAGMAFGALRDLNVEMISMGANEINLSLVVRREDAPEALRRLHRAFFGPESGLNSKRGAA